MDTETHNSIYRCLRAERIFAELLSGICYRHQELRELWKATDLAETVQQEGEFSDMHRTCDQFTLSQGTVALWKLFELEGENPLIKRFLNPASA